MGDFMESSINKFIELLIKGDFFLVFLIGMAIVIISVIVYLVKLQITDNAYYLEDDEVEDDNDYVEKTIESIIPKEEIVMEPLKEETVMNITNVNSQNNEELSLEEIEEEIETIEETREEVKEVIEDVIKETPKPVQSRFEFVTQEEQPMEVEEQEEINEPIKEEVKKFESDQEEFAIISASELENRLNEMRENGEFERHQENIKTYEEEQELKAIISYDELLKRASANVINYESEEEIGGIKVGKVDTKSTPLINEEGDKPYYKEESFLNALKEFRSTL